MLLKFERYKEIIIIPPAHSVSLFQRLYGSLKGKHYILADSQHGDWALNNAYDSLPKNPGGGLFVGEGELTISATVNPVSNSILSGVNQQSAVLKAADGLNADVISPLSVNDVYFRDFKIDGNKANQDGAPNCALQFRHVTEGEIRRVKVVDAYYIGIGIGGVGDPGTSYRIRVVDCYIDASGDNGLDINSCSYVIARGNFIANAGNDGLFLGHGDSIGTILDGNIVVSAAHRGIGIYNEAYGVEATNMYALRVVNNFIVTPAAQGIGCGGIQMSVIEGNTINDPGNVGIDLYGIASGADHESLYNSVVGNVIWMVGDMFFGVREADAGDYNSIVGNVVYSTSGISIVGANTEIGHNPGG